MKALRFLSIFAALLCLTAFMCLSVAATTWPAHEGVYDDGELLSEEAEQAISEALIAAEEKTERTVDFYVATYTANSYGDDYIGDEFCRDRALDKKESIVLLIITYDLSDRTYYYDMYTYGDVTYDISTKEVNYILDSRDVYNNLKSGRLTEGVCSFLELSATAAMGRVGASYAVIIPICAIIALIIAFVVCTAVKRAYTTKNKPIDYPLERFATLSLTHQSDTSKGKFVTAVRLSSGSGSGGHSRHGGGGGHRGGR